MTCLRRTFVPVAGSPKHSRGHVVTESAMLKHMGRYTDFVTQAVRRYTALGVLEFAI